MDKIASGKYDTTPRAGAAMPVAIPLYVYSAHTGIRIEAVCVGEEDSFAGATCVYRVRKGNKDEMARNYGDVAAGESPEAARKSGRD